MYSKYNFSIFNPTNAIQSIHFIDVGYHDHTKVEAFSTKPRSQFYHTFHIVLEGQGTLSYEDKVYKLSPGTIFYLPPFIKSLYLPKKSDPYKFVWIGIEGDEFVNILRKKGITASSPIIHSKNPKKMCAFLTDFLENNTQRNTTEEKLLSFFFSFIDLIKDQTTSNSKSQPATEYVNAVKALIENNYMHARFTIHSITHIMHISHSWLCALFKKQTSMSMHQYLITVRLQHAAKLLIDTDLSVNEISFLCGFCDPLYFSAAFKKQLAVSPSYYRKKYKTK
ncbi:MAG: AraC family transcriptional regulator [Clostridia bacterium]|nr:AraC family transcriptional regulator [Clostridia bacterium]